jgi:RHS repeat-associated protein
MNTRSGDVNVTVTSRHENAGAGSGFCLVAAGRLPRDGVPPVRAITSAVGVKIESALYKPFGDEYEWLLPGNAAPETKGWIGERFDAAAGVQYLNARYYDPELSLFLQPDWFEVTKAGVGTHTGKHFELGACVSI